MKIPIWLVPLALITLLAGCSSLRVRSDWDREIDFSRYHTYRWAPTERTADRKPRADRSLLDKRIRRSVDRVLADKGFARRESGPTDLLLVYQASSHDRVDVYRYPYHYGGARAYRYREGELLILVVDPDLGDQGQVVWQGAGVGVVHRADDPEEEITRAVRKILEDFPPQ